MIEGFYFDPWHGGCLRRISMVKENQYKIHGVYGNDEIIKQPKNVEYHPESSEKTNKYWYAIMEICKVEKNLYYLKVYFKGKPGKKRLYYDAVYDEKKRRIKWDDTNIWKQLYYHKKQLIT
tara:strand:- start:758 stop:1120 length:363 start_codon:yes stop_codon:yes gene_type:complete